MNFGFSYTGFIFLLALFIPNILWARNMPAGYESLAAGENRILLFFERAGQVLVSATILIFKDFNYRPAAPGGLWLLAAGFMMVLYEIWWIRYFKGDKTLKDFYSPLFFIPVPGAVLPVAARRCIGIYGRNIPLTAANIILGIGHIGIHISHLKEIK